MNRRSGPNDYDDGQNDQMYGMSLQWVGLLFAAFASGAQFTTLPKKERDLVSQVYGKLDTLLSVLFIISLTLVVFSLLFFRMPSPHQLPVKSLQ